MAYILESDSGNHRLMALSTDFLLIVRPVLNHWQPSANTIFAQWVAAFGTEVTGIVPNQDPIIIDGIHFDVGTAFDTRGYFGVRHLGPSIPNTPHPGTDKSWNLVRPDIGIGR